MAHDRGALYECCMNECACQTIAGPKGVPMVGMWSLQEALRLWSMRGAPARAQLADRLSLHAD